ncbi:MAG: M67 family metallopeptidase [Magnetococcales bacterium]|nr:M67 family metallopeptidase [Magnetococcales bacterium]NGZ27069.1 M67 family metallopeptidase [Magnetococcales bacterium]
MWIIPRSIINKMFSHAQRSLPRECVGLLSGSGQTVSHWHPLVNIAEGEHTFLAEPAGQIAAFRTIREEGRQLLAIYHSHPHASTNPSSRDLAELYYPDALQVIIAMNTEGRMEMACFLLEGDRLIHPELHICE